MLAHLNIPIKLYVGQRKRLEKEKGNIMKRENDTMPWDKQAVMIEIFF